MGLNDRKNRFLLVYGSATGQAQAIAEEIAEKAPTFGLCADLHPLEETGKRFNIENEKCMVLITSTTGDGDPPANAEKFMRRIKKRTLSRDYLSHLNYTVLGLGDSNYSNFCRCARDMDNRLEAIGAQRFYPTGLADDGVGLEVVADPWLEGLYPALQKFLGVSPTSETSLTEKVQSLSLSDSKSLDRSTNSGGEEIALTLKSPVITAVASTVENCDADSSNTDLSVKASLKNHSGSDETLSGSHSVSTSNSDTSEVSCVLLASPSSDNSNNSQNDSAYSSDVSIKESLSNNAMNETSSQDEKNIEVSSSSSPPPANHDIISSATSDMDTLSVQECANLSDSLTVDSHENLALQPLSRPKYQETPCVPLTTTEPSTVTPSLTHSQPPLSEQALTVPVLPPPFLNTTFSTQSTEVSSLTYQNECKLPSAASEIFHVPIVIAKVLTSPDAVKKTLLLQLDLQGTDIKYCPGDSISIICPNNTSEVNLLLDRLDVSDRADDMVTLSVIPDTKKRRAAIPPHVHPTSTLRHIFTTCLNIREPPSKAFIRALIDHTTDTNEVRRMQELCSKEGGQEYTHFIRESYISFLDFLYAFPSCKPPVARVIEHLPRLQPRPYSACSCQETSLHNLNIVFNVVEISANKDKGHYYDRRGVCTGWLDDISSSLQAGNSEGKLEIPVFLRSNQHFRPSDDLSKPVIMIGPGTGVAPFIGFLQQRALRKSQMKDGENYGETWLFYGCRNKDKDYLFREDLQQLESDGILTKLCVAFSRDQPSVSSETVSPPPRYVQDQMHSFSSEICGLLTESEVLVYVCGDAKNMAKDVNAAFEEILQKEKGMSQEDAHMFIMKKRIHKSYLEDVWV